MVDKYRRKKLAFYMRQLSVGLISNDDFEFGICEEVTNGWLPEQYYRSRNAIKDDPAMMPTLELCWGLYDDTRNHKLNGSNKLSPESLKIIARCILFLHTELEYEWPFFDTKSPIFRFSLTDFLIYLLTLGQNYRNRRKAQLAEYEVFKRKGDFNFWPFYREVDYESCLKRQPFMSKQKQQLDSHSL